MLQHWNFSGVIRKSNSSSRLSWYWYLFFFSAWKIIISYGNFLKLFLSSYECNFFHLSFYQRDLRMHYWTYLIIFLFWFSCELKAVKRYAILNLVSHTYNYLIILLRYMINYKFLFESMTPLIFSKKLVYVLPGVGREKVGIFVFCDSSNLFKMPMLLKDVSFPNAIDHINSVDSFRYRCLNHRCFQCSLQK